MKKEEIIKKLNLEPLIPEGGYVRSMYRGKNVNDRESYGTIYYLLTPDAVSRMHKLEDDEIWYYHDGPALEMYLIYEDHDEVRYLGKDLMKNEEPQIRVEAGVYMGAHMKENGEYTLVSTSMTPAYIDEEFSLGSYDLLKDKSNHLQLLELLTK